MRAPFYSSNPNELFEPTTISNPHPLYSRLRTETPLSRVDETGVHLVATWDLIEEALAREFDFSANLTGVLMRSSSGAPTIFELPDSISGRDSLATADEPDHSVHRAIVQPRFSRTALSVLEKAVRRWTQEAVREWLGAGAGDFVPVAELIPARVVGDLLGLPDGDVSRFRTWAMIGGNILAGDVDEARLGLIAEEAIKMAEYLGEHLDRAIENLRREAEAPMMHVLAGAVKTDKIHRDTAIVIATTMFSAGGESTAALIGTMVRYLAEHPEIARVLRQNHELIPRFVEEVARLDPPFNFHYRAVRRSCELAGFELHPGDRLMLLWASANRDPARVDNPDELRLDREYAKDHLTFGRGGHFCIGAPIARMEARIVCEELLSATDTITRKPGHEPAYARSIMVRRLEHLLLDAAPAIHALPT